MSGGVMSPLLFGVYIDELLSELKYSGTGCYIGSYYCGIFGYADDIILICPTITGLEHMIKMYEVYSDKHCINFNGKKSKLLIFGTKIKDPMIKVKNENVLVCETAEYLGDMLSTNDFNDIVNKL